MKRIIAILMSIMMLVTLAVGSSAAGIIWKDDFSGGFLASNWILDGNAFFLDDLTDSSNPTLAAYESGKVCQMEYRYDMSSTPRLFTNCDFSVNIQIRDYGLDPTDHFVGLWWRDDFVYISDADGGDVGYELGEIWNLIYEHETEELVLKVEGEEAARTSVSVAGKIAVGGDWFNLGWKITPGRMCAYLDNEKLIDYSSEDISAATGSPILLLNGNFYSAWDDVTVADLDYNLFNEPAEQDTTTAPVDGGENDVTTAPVDGGENDVTTAPVDGGNDDAGNDNAGNDNSGNDNAGNDNSGNDNAGNDNSGNDNAGNDNSGNDNAGNNAGNDNAGNDNAANNNTGNNAGGNVPADTNVNKPVGGASTSTGDAAFAVAVVMVAALGCAIIVKKVTVR